MAIVNAVHIIGIAFRTAIFQFTIFTPLHIPIILIVDNQIFKVYRINFYNIKRLKSKLGYSKPRKDKPE
jgi:hypothetical protein